MKPILDTVGGHGRKSEHGRYPVHGDESRSEADRHQIHPPDAGFTGQPTELLTFGMVEGFDRGMIREAGSNLDQKPGAATRADEIDFATSNPEVAAFDIDPVPLKERCSDPFPRSPDVTPSIAHTPRLSDRPDRSADRLLSVTHCVGRIA